MARNGWMKVPSMSHLGTGQREVARSTRMRFGTALGAVVVIGAAVALVMWQTAGEYPGIEERATQECESIARETQDLPASARFVNTEVMRNADYDRARLEQFERETTDLPDNWRTIRAERTEMIEAREVEENETGMWSLYVGGEILLSPGSEEPKVVTWECFALAHGGVVRGGYMWEYDGERAPPPG